MSHIESDGETLRVERERLIDKAADAFALGHIDQSDFESLVDLFSHADLAQLKSLEKTMPLLSDAPPSSKSQWQDRASQVHPNKDQAHESRNDSVQASGKPPILLKKRMGDLDRDGRWLEGRSYQVFGTLASFYLDLSAYEGEQDFFVEFDVLLHMSEFTLVVPRDWLVNCDFVDSPTGEIENKRPHGSRGNSGNQVVLRGSLTLASVRVEYE